MIEVRNLSLTYPDGTKAIEDISFSVGDGESIALVGANGAGKTSRPRKSKRSLTATRRSSNPPSSASHPNCRKKTSWRPLS